MNLCVQCQLTANRHLDHLQCMVLIEPPLPLLLLILLLMSKIKRIRQGRLKYNFLFGDNTTVTALLGKHKHRLYPCNQQQMIINPHRNNVPFFYNLTKIKRYPFMIVLNHKNCLVLEQPCLSWRYENVQPIVAFIFSDVLRSNGNSCSNRCDCIGFQCHNS